MQTSQNPYIKWLAAALVFLFVAYWVDQIMAARHFIPAPVISQIAFPCMVACAAMILLAIDSTGNLLAQIEKVLTALTKVQTTTPPIPAAGGYSLTVVSPPTDPQSPRL